MHKHDVLSVLEVERDGLASVPQACAYLGVCRSMVYRLLQRGEIPSVKIGARRLIPWRALQAYVAERIQG